MLYGLLVMKTLSQVVGEVLEVPGMKQLCNC